MLTDYKSRRLNGFSAIMTIIQPYSVRVTHSSPKSTHRTRQHRAKDPNIFNFLCARSVLRREPEWAWHISDLLSLSDVEWESQGHVASWAKGFAHRPLIARDCHLTAIDKIDSFNCHTHLQRWFNTLLALRKFKDSCPLTPFWQSWGYTRGMSCSRFRTQLNCSTWWTWLTILGD